MPAADSQRTGFARTEDGLQLYWRVVGHGPPMVCCNGVGVSTFFFKYVAQHYRETYSVVLWDYRGHGRSGTPVDVEAADLSVERCAKDLKNVLESADLVQPAVLVGHSMGCQVILEFAKQEPGLVRALIPMFGTFARPLDTFMDSPYSRRVFNFVEKLAARGGKSSARLLKPLYASPLAAAVGRMSGMVDRHYVEPVDLDRYLEHLVHMDQRVFLRMVSLMADHDLTDFLPHITAPTLIVAGEKDLFTPLHRSRAMNALIPRSELFVLAEGSHAAIVEHPEMINRRMDRFLRDRLPRAALAAP
jgi:pimeloyl-ACP methyl ester carboxylesterase